MHMFRTLALMPWTMASAAIATGLRLWLDMTMTEEEFAAKIEETSGWWHHMEEDQ